MSVTLCCFLYRCSYHPDLHGLTHSVPTRRSSDLWNSIAASAASCSTMRSRGRSRFPPPRWQRHGSPATPSAAPILPLRATISPPEDSKRSEEHTSELQSLMRISYAVFCLNKKTQTPKNTRTATCDEHNTR